MRVLIMSDMEGVSGIVVWEQVMGGEPMFEEGRVLYTEEINATVRGAKAAGATEIVVVDCHGAGQGWSFNSLIPERLDPDCQWVAHHAWGRYTEMWERGCDACLLIGMHARSDTLGGVAESHHLGRPLQGPVVQRRFGRRDRCERRPERALRRPGGAGQRRRGRLP